MRSLTTLVALISATVSTVRCVNPVVVKEQEFADSKTGDRFMIIGVDYQPGGQAAYGTGAGDPLSNGTSCLRDAALMQYLGVNTIRSYNVEPTLNHDECVSIFNEAGIYMIIDVNSPLSGQSINRADPASSYNAAYLGHIFSVVEAFKDYPNTLGFFAGNEIINDDATASNTPPYIRAVQRDLKNYIAKHSSRSIPVGYSAADVADVLEDTWAYLQCSISNDTNDASRSDFFGLNDYSWCGNASSFTISGYDTLVATFSNTTIPVFFSEYGCNDPEPRVFDEVPVLYGPQMTVLSGGLVYQWTQDVSDFGLVQLYSNGTAQILGDYDRLMGKYDTLNITLLESSNSTATSLQPPTCNANLISGNFSTDFNIPDTPAGGLSYISNGIPNPPTGSLVSVTQTSVAAHVYATNGGLLQGLQIRSASTANVPGAETGVTTLPPGSTASAATTTATTSASSSTSKAWAVPTAAPVDGSVLFHAAGAAAMGVLAFVL